MKKGFLIEVMAPGQVNLLPNVLNTQFLAFLPWMVLFSPLGGFCPRGL